MTIVQDFKQFNLQDWLNKIASESIMLTYTGNFTSDVITNQLSIAENILETLNINNKSSKVIYNVLIEVLQNLYHHSTYNVYSNENKEIKWASFTLFKNNGFYTLQVGNFIEAKFYNILKEKIDYINSLNKEELKEFYIKTLNNDKYSDKGGGGLGLIDISKKTGSKLEYVFYSFNNEYLFYNLNINIL